MIAERLVDTDHCTLAARWGVREDVMQKVKAAAAEMEFHTKIPVWIISGFRTKEEQATLIRRGGFVAMESLSTHRSCPATGVDVWLGELNDDATKVSWGFFVRNAGLRWGGGSPLDERLKIPGDWTHVDVGPRVSD